MESSDEDIVEVPEDALHVMKIKMAIFREWMSKNAHEHKHAFKTVFVLGVITGGAVLAYKYITKTDYVYPPGPLALPCIGNLHTIGTKNIYLEVHRLSEQYGHALTIWMGIKPMVIVNSLELTREALMHDTLAEVPGKPYVWKDPRDVLGHVPRKLMSTITQTVHDIAEAAANDYLLGQRADVLLGAVFGDFKNRMNKLEASFDIFPQITLMIYSFLNKLFFRTNTPIKDQLFTQTLEFHAELHKRFINGGPVDVLSWNPINYRYNDEHAHRLHDVSAFYKQYFTNEFERQFKQFNPDNVRHLTDQIVRQWRRITEEGQVSADVLNHISQDHFIHLLGDVFYSASDTARILLTNVIGYMCAYPEIQDKLQQELADVLGTERMTFESIKDLPYTEAVIREVSRMTTIRPLPEYETTADTHFGEYFIPKNTSVCINLWGIHHNPKYFPFPDQFHPERWLDQQGKFIDHLDDIERTMCRRFCLGELLSKVEVYVLTGMIFKNFTFKAGPAQQVPPVCDEILGTLEMEGLTIIATPKDKSEFKKAQSREMSLNKLEKTSASVTDKAMSQTGVKDAS